MKRGLTHIYTGEGKGKTTASVGIAVRAKSSGLRVLFAQFMKMTKGGETELLKKNHIDVIRFDKIPSPFFHPDLDRKKAIEEAKKAIKKLSARLAEYDLVVLDEFTYLITERLVSKEGAEEFISKRPAGTEMVLTGRGAPRWLIGLADYVTEMKEIKHPLAKNVKARKGIEY